MAQAQVAPTTLDEQEPVRELQYNYEACEYSVQGISEFVGNPVKTEQRKKKKSRSKSRKKKKVKRGETKTSYDSPTRAEEKEEVVFLKTTNDFYDYAPNRSTTLETTTDAQIDRSKFLEQGRREAGPSPLPP